MQKVRTKGLWAALLTIAMLLSLAMPAQAAVPDGASQVADTDSLYGYRGDKGALADSNENAGRIWTDKSVFTGDYTLSSDEDAEDPVDNVTVKMDTEGANFMVALSALSSAEASSTSQTAGPMDIILVLDRSGSMAENLSSSNTYRPTYNVSESFFAPTYYALVNGQYVSIRRVAGSWGRFDHWELNGQEVEPMRNAGDTGSGRIQFYTYQRESITKEDAMKEAVGSFIDIVAAANKNADGTAKPSEKQHRIAVVSYAASASIDSDFTNVTDTTAGTLKEEVNNLTMNGGTYADEGMEAAQVVMDGGDYGYRPYNGAREDANKVLIYFTDGEPGGGGDTDPEVAGPALNTANELKNNSGVTIYSIGVMNGADPSDTNSVMNAYMNGISSNYPEAIWNTTTGWSQTYDDKPVLGDRVPEDKQYYFATQNSDELSQIFEDIFNEQNEANDPTLVEGGDAAQSGYITFFDPLGDFMEVKGFEAVVFNGKQYNNVSEKTDDITKVTTYTFESGNIDSGNHNDTTLESLIIEVQHSADLQTGDVVTVKIPASLIPVRQYTVTTVDNSTGLDVVRKMPIRIFYSVGLKDEINALYTAAGGTADAKTALETYGTKDASGNYLFYSNKYTQANGDTTVTFKPNTTNDFYYFTKNTELFSDQNGTVYQGNQPTGTLYYLHRYYTLNNGETTATDEYLTIDCNVYNYNADCFVQEDGSWYVKGGTPKYDRSAQYAARKVENSTDTADNVVTPSWDQDSANMTVTVALGNNGRITAPAPTPDPVTISGDTGIKVQKTVTGADTNADFAFKLTLTSAKDAENKDITGGVFTNADATTAFPSDGMTLTFNEAFRKDTPQTGTFGAITFTKAGTYTFTVDETTETPSPANGWTYDNSTHTVSVVVTKSTTENKLQATVQYEGTASAASFTNKYTAAPVTQNDSQVFQVVKNLVGRTWDENLDKDQYTFTLTAQDGAPEPSEKTVTATGDGEVVTFPAITFNNPGTYTYEIKENTFNVQGVTGDGNTATVTVTVADNGNGSLEITDTTYVNTVSAEVTDEAVFTNTYAASGVLDGATNLKVTKVLNGREWQQGDSFQFTLTTGDNITKKAVDNGTVTMPSAEIIIDNTSSNHQNAFGNITFTEAGSYCFKVTETAGSLPNMTYDTEPQYLFIQVDDEYKNGTLTVAVEDGSDDLTFTNTYTEPVAENSYPISLHGTKVLYGRQLKKAEFYFNVTPLKGAPMGDSYETANPNGVSEGDVGDIVLLNNIVYTEADLEGAASKDFQYVITEDVPSAASAGAGMTYDNTAYRVTVTVTKADGKLTAATPKIEAGTWNEGTFTKEKDVDEIVFTNTYSPDEVVLSGADNLTVTKQLVGRDEWTQEDTYEFTLAAGDEATVTAVNDGDVILPVTTITIDSSAAEHQASFGDITFKQAGNYVFTVSEVQGNVTGVTYDPDSTRRIYVKVEDRSGALFATLDNGTEDLTFTNTYNPTEAKLDGAGNLTVTKNLEGREMTDSDVFEFLLAAGDEETLNAIAAEDIVMPNLTKLEITGATENHQASFGDITFKKAGTYTFEVSELATNIPGVVNDPDNTRVVTVSVTDTNGLLSAALVTEQSDSLTFTNTYHATETTLPGATNLAVTKVLTGRPQDAWLDTDSFSFLLRASGNTADEVRNGSIVMPTNAGGIVIDSKTPDHTASFGDITFTKAGTYTFEVVEMATSIPGVTNDPDDTRSLTVSVTDTNGVLSAELVAEQSESLTFTNTYKTKETVIGGEGDASLTVTKNFIGRDWTDDDSFSFTLTAANEDAKTVLPEAETITISKASADHKAAFTALTFQKAATYVFTVQEVVPDGVDENNTLNGITYDSEPRTLTINVTDNGDGSMTAAVDAAHSEPLVFTNTYDANFPDNPEGNSLAQVPVRKEISGDRNAMLEGESYDFTITPDTDKTTVDDALIPTADNATLTLNASKPEDLFSIDFSELHDKAEALLSRAQSGDEETEEVEQPEEEPKDEATETENEEGTVSNEEVVGVAKLAAATAETAQPDVDEPETTPTEPDEKTDAVQAMPNIATMSLAEVQNLDAEQAATLLEQICGDYYYTVSESTKQEDMRGGMTKDQSVYQVKITLRDKGDGTLELSKPEITKIVDNSGNAIAADKQTKVEKALFTNVYTLANSETTATISGTKVLNGRELKEGEFTFYLMDANGEVVQETTNRADGSFSFDLTYTKDQAGDYFGYTVKEVRGTDSTITYDGSVFAVQVHVVDDGNGTLSAEVTPLNGEIEFNNTYTKPQEETTTPTATPKPTPAPTSTPEPQAAPSIIPQTGDSFPYMLLVVIACAAVVGLCVTFYVKKRKER